MSGAKESASAGGFELVRARVSHRSPQLGLVTESKRESRRGEMWQTFARLVEWLTERSLQPPPVDDELARWLAAVLVVALAAIAYRAPKEAYVLLLVLLVVAFFVAGRGKAT
jgi:hypothetical protein